MAALSIEARDPASRARAATLHTAHGDVRTPAFVPLATKATVKGLLPEEVAALGYEMVLGNTFHLLLSPGPELIERFGGAAPLHGLGAADHHRLRRLPGLLDGPRHRRRRDQGPRAVAIGRVQLGASAAERSSSIEEEGVRFRSYVDGRERFLSPEGSMAVQAALGSDIALVFDECTPFHVDRDYTERSTERTHRWLERCLRWHAEHGPRRSSCVYGIVQGGVHEDLRRASARTVAASGCDGVAIGGSLGADKAQMYEVVGYATRELGGAHEALPRHLLGIGEVDDLIAGVELGIDTFDCAMPTRLGRHGTALVPDPAQPLAPRSAQGPLARVAGAAARGLPLPRLRARALARLPLLSRARRRAHRHAAADAAQPRLHRAADGRPARRDPRRAPPRGGRRAARGRRRAPAADGAGGQARAGAT